MKLFLCIDRVLLDINKFKQNRMKNLKFLVMKQSYSKRNSKIIKIKIKKPSNCIII